jgi:hypothetical protein
MAIKVKKNTISTARLNAGDSKTGSTSYNNGNGYDSSSQRPQITPPRPGDNKWVIWVVLGGFVVIILCLCAAGAGKKGRRQTTQMRYVSRSSQRQTKEQLKKYEQLDGKTMGQWMKDNKVNTRALRERRQRMLKHAYSRTMPQDVEEYEEE